MSRRHHHNLIIKARSLLLAHQHCIRFCNESTELKRRRSIIENANNWIFSRGNARIRADVRADFFQRIIGVSQTTR
jgi:hypothetical protein